MAFVYRSAITMLILGALSGCAKINTQAIVPGQTSVSQVKQLLGPPTCEDAAQVVRGQKILCYPDGVTVQFNDGTKTVSALSRRPKGEERFVQHWRHRWKGLEQHESPLPSASTGRAHGQAIRQLVVKSEGMAVVYDSETGIVEKVVSFGSR